MLVAPIQIGLILVGLALGEPTVGSESIEGIDASYFEGRWAFEEASCQEPSSWTMIAGGNFVSEDLIGTWHWEEKRLTLSLTDLAIDEETGETGGKFQMDGPVVIVASDSFKMTVAPEVYTMKRCPD